MKKFDKYFKEAEECYHTHVVHSGTHHDQAIEMYIRARKRADEELQASVTAMILGNIEDFELKIKRLKDLNIAWQKDCEIKEKEITTLKILVRQAKMLMTTSTVNGHGWNEFLKVAGMLK